MFDLRDTERQTNQSLNTEYVTCQEPPLAEFKTSVVQGTLSRDILKKIRKNVSDSHYIDSVMTAMTVEQLIELQIFLWHEAMDFTENTLHRKLAREFITSRMEPTANYHRRQMCSEPLTACRANYCVHSNPMCASQKLREQIRGMVTLFDRRSCRAEQQDKALEKYLQNIIRKFGLFAVVVTTGDGLPVAALSDLEQSGGSEHSEFVQFFYRHLERYAKSGSMNGSVYFDLPLQAVSHKMVVAQNTLILTLLSVKNVNLDVAMFQATFGIERIYHEDHSNTVTPTKDIPYESVA